MGGTGGTVLTEDASSEHSFTSLEMSSFPNLQCLGSGPVLGPRYRHFSFRGSIDETIFWAYRTFEVYINSNRNTTQIYKKSVPHVYFSVKLCPRGNIFTFNRVESSIRLTLC